MKNAIKLSLVILGFVGLTFIPEECQPTYEGELSVMTIEQPTNDVATFEA